MSTTYKIQPGDTLSEIAKKLGTTVSQLAKENNIANWDNIRAGDLLTISGVKTSSITDPLGVNKPSTDTNASSADTSESSTGFQYKDFEYDKTFDYGDFSYGDYEESDTVKAAKAALEAQLAQKPGEYQSQWQAQLDATINKILNREKFSYDFNGDALYQQYKDKYIQQGKMAMADTMGQAAAMTGGYGNSYAATVGNQAYQQSLQQLNDIVPELYQMAYDRYNQEGQDLYNQYAMLGDRENTDYGRYRDTVADWQTERDYLTGRYDSERDYDYSKYTDDRNFKYNQYANDRDFAYGQFVDDRNFAYGQYADDKSYAYNDYRNAIEDARKQAEFDEAVRQYNEQFQYQKDRDAVADAQWQAERWDSQQAALRAAASSNNSGSGSDSDFKKATFSRIDDNGNYVFYIDGKEFTYAPGVNPYTGTTNKDVKNGTFDNGYQPNNVNGQKLSKTGITDVVNGVTQNVWQTPDGTKWIWDGTQNKYLRYED